MTFVTKITLVLVDSNGDDASNMDASIWESTALAGISFQQLILLCLAGKRIETLKMFLTLFAIDGLMLKNIVRYALYFLSFIYQVIFKVIVSVLLSYSI